MILKKITNKPIKSLYVHIPYCDHICFYCDFVKIIKPKNDASIDNYLNLIEKELKNYQDKLNEIDSIYIGGGTPSCLNNLQTIKLCEILSKYVNKQNFEFSIELNPESITETKLKIYRYYKINRLSIGVQTFDNKLLTKIGRVHNRDEVIKKYELARKIGFKNINIDLMYNLFGQTAENIQTDLKYIKKLAPDHISWYSLIMKDDSIWGKKKLKLPQNDEFFDEIINNGLTELGYFRYEVSNYCLADKKSIHNLTYWNNSLFVGIGLGASGFEQIDGNYFLTKNTGTTLNFWKETEMLTEEDYFFQILMMGLRLVEGINLLFEDNLKMYNFFKEKINIKIENNLLELKNNYLSCTKKGFDLLNEILIDFL